MNILVVRIGEETTNLLYLFTDIFLVAFIVFTILLGFFILLFSTKNNRLDGLLLVLVGLVSGAIFYYLYWYHFNIWKRIFFVESLFSDLGAFFGIMAAMGIVIAVLIKTNKR